MRISIILTDEGTGDLNLGSYPEENQTVALKVTILLATGKYLIHTHYNNRCKRYLFLGYVYIL